MELNYYEILEISQTSDKETIKKAYRKMALKYHPDRNQGDKEAEEKFKLVNEAYEVLSNDEKRSIYDRYGKEGLKGQAGGFGGFGDVDLGDIFSSFFGDGFGFGSSTRKKEKGNKYPQDLKITTKISFKEAVFGCKKKIDFSYKSFCKSCKGSGSENGKLDTCPHCGGKGQVGVRQGFMTFVQSCDHCKGSGQIIKDKCKTCHGNGYEEIKDHIELDIPEGIDSGMSLRVQNKANELPNSSQRGDLYIKIIVEDDDKFIRHDDDIYTIVPVFFTQAALGKTIKVSTIRGEADLKLPVGAKDKQKFELTNEGVKNIHNGKLGSHIVQIEIKFPKNLTDEQKNLLLQLEKSFGLADEEAFIEQESLFDKIKSWFSH
ncbi:molecular chaperone DnaJ [Campylobacter lari]|uniref:Chaperone protein DnaJ n=2 Tax=Campylobacter lari TaxID=201 RepID=DNAJ_CAMLR|nr:molecular chaperone DnaJ [Campylobacter lari]B9KFK6.1 RecName: Full=Chaperone protein DnaJ [Campylobacter lari RM2100]ACM63841.1 DnaK system heat shock co-chaperone [Campylobacter lari RM2100]EAJ0334401.1 molecular chaperone DnaJ [Campylobacter lari]EAJ0337646.1 molecular chaperone DnaJ [Campylobacter lari]EAK0443523.1 molecular chaperone DnaJ [Campylobacter lari]EAK0793985.1 molecular chaperone DnaJ [Campylobacter lari]